jgi:predicted metal-dependent peptidase
MKFEDLKLAKRILLSRSPFIASLIFRLKLEVDNSPDNPTACTNGESIRFNTDFLETLNLEQTITLLAHETLHVSLCHHLRMVGKTLDRWRIATDHSINLLLRKMGFTPLKDWLCDPQYENMSAEQIYLLLPDESNPDDVKRSKVGAFKSPPNMTNEDKAQAKQRARVDLQRAIDTQKQIERSIKNSPHVPERDKKQQLAEMGKTLSNFEDIIKEFTQTQTPWREILQQFISSFSYNDYSYSQPNRYNVSEFYMPGLYQGEPGNITLALDVSGSTATIAHRIANEIFSALTVLHEGEDPQLNIIYCSNYIHEDVIISHPDEIKTIIGGGTSFNPVMKRMQDKTSQGLIYITDGLCHDFGEAPPQPVLWAIVGNHVRFNPPFGEVIYID